MGSKSPADLGSDYWDTELLSEPIPRDVCSVCQRPTAHTSKSATFCTCNTPNQLSQPENISNKKRKKFEKPTSSLSKRQLFPGDLTRQVGPVKDEIKEEEISIPTFLHTCRVCEEQFFSSNDLSHHLELHHPATSSGTSLTPNVTIPNLPPPPSPTPRPNPPRPRLRPPSTSTQIPTGKTPLERPYACSNCSKAFSSKFKLMRHILIHSDSRQYRCTTCEKTFHRKDHLKNHIKVHNPVKRRYKCEKEDCGKEYSSILSFKKHNAVHSVEEGSLDCKICGNLFASKEDIVIHLKIHSGSRTMKTPADRKYHCQWCDRSFFTGKDVRRHAVVHTGRRDFLCQYCPQRFGRKDHLTRHIKKSHNNSSKKNKMRKTPQSSSPSEEKGQSRRENVLDLETCLSFEQKIIDPLSANVKEVCETITSGFYKEPKREENTEDNVLYVTLPYEETAGPSAEYPSSHFQPYPPDNIKLEESDFNADNNEGLSSLIELMPIMSSNEIDTDTTSEFLEAGDEPGQFLNFNTHELLSLYSIDSSEASNSQITPLPRFSQAFNVSQHPAPDQEHSTDELHLSDPNSN